MIGRLMISVTIYSLAGYLYLITFSKIVESNTLKLLAYIILFIINLGISFFIFIPTTITISEKKLRLTFSSYLFIFLIAGLIILNIMFFIWGWLASGAYLQFYAGNNKYFSKFLITGYICYLTTTICYASSTYKVVVRKGF